MPSYTYKCDQCGHETEWLHAVHTRASLECNSCGHAPMTWQFPCPNIQTETTFLANRDDGFGTDERSRKRAYAKARAAGVNPSGKIYCPSLCPLGEPLSPKAWVNDKADIKRICRKNNWSSETLGVTADKIEVAPKPYRVADDIVTDAVDRVVTERGGDVSPREHKTLRRETRERLTGTV